MKKLFSMAALLFALAACHRPEMPVQPIGQATQAGESITITATLAPKTGPTKAVADNGDGMPEDQLPYIFEPLFTTDDSRKVAGLGLAICKESVERGGGTIEAGPSEAYGGLEITIIMPRTDRTAKDHT